MLTEFNVNEFPLLGVRLLNSGLILNQPKRIWRIRWALEHVLAVGKCSGKELERLIGHVTFMFLIRREMLSLLSTCYAFIEQNYDRRCWLWKCLKNELSTVLALLPLALADVCAPWSTEVVCTDACEYGYGACSSQWDAGDVQRVGAVHERWRYRDSSAVQAREHAALAASLWSGAAPPPCKQPSPPPAGSGPAACSPRSPPAACTTQQQMPSAATVQQSPCSSHVLYDANAAAVDDAQQQSMNVAHESLIHDRDSNGRNLEFEEVPHVLATNAEWKVLGARRFLKPESINVLEGRAALWGLRHKPRSVHSIRRRHLILVDNLSVALAIDRGRSSGSLNKICRKWCALMLASLKCPFERNGLNNR